MNLDLIVKKCIKGHLCYPTHALCPNCRSIMSEETVNLSQLEGTVITWTTSTVPPPGVRSPNILAIVEYEVGGESVKLIGGIENESVKIGDKVRPVYSSQLRDPDHCQRVMECQKWSGHRFEILDKDN